MSNAVRLLLLCARLEMSEAQRQEARHTIEQGVVWEDLDRLATRHALLGLLHRNLDALGPAHVPKAVLASLWARHEANARRNRAMASELGNILVMLEGAGIAAVPYKGPTLALAVYRDPALREFGDLDLLVRPRDVTRIKELLQTGGYVPGYRLTPELEAELVRSTRHYELPLVQPVRRVMVELHWRTDPEFPVVDLDDPRWWASRPKVSFDGRQVLALSPSELLLILGLHGSKHFWGSLGWLVDVAELLRQDPGLEWPWIVARARALGCTRKLGLGLALARDLLQAPLPAEVNDLVGDPVVASMAQELVPGLWVPEYHAMPLADALRANMRLQDNRRRALGHLLAMLFTPGLGEWQRWSLPRILFPLYWPLRWVRLAEKYLLRRTPPAAKPRTPPPQPHSTG